MGGVCLKFSYGYSKEIKFPQFHIFSAINEKLGPMSPYRAPVQAHFRFCFSLPRSV